LRAKTVYEKTEIIRYLALNLLWKPTKDLVRIILVLSSHGPIVLQTTDILAKLYPTEIVATARCWLRTVCANTPSEFIARIALTNTIRHFLASFANDPIAAIIRIKQGKQAVDNIAAWDKLAIVEVIQ